ncbi:MAG: YggT family protein [Psychromonas sp.]|nr:YggT family protein [Psychromonas sp.]
MNAINFLVDTIFDIYIMLVLIRVWLQVAHADFYNPFSQFVVKVTQPIVGPLRRVMPTVAGLDLAAIFFAFFVACLKVFALTMIRNGFFNWQVILTSGGIVLITAVFKLIFWVLILRAILSWVSRGDNPIEAVMIQLSEPLLSPVRRVIPPIGGLDLSMIVVLIALQFVEYLTSDLINRLIS